MLTIAQIDSLAPLILAQIYQLPLQNDHAKEVIATFAVVLVVAPSGIKSTNRPSHVRHVIIPPLPRCHDRPAQIQIARLVRRLRIFQSLTKRIRI
jgi:hypothetical protein